MHVRRLDGKAVRFGHSGILYGNSFVMYERETGSLFVHVTGRAESGPYQGRQLEFFPSTMTTWSEWKRAHPNTLVLPGRRRGGFMGTYTGTRSPAGIGLVVLVAFEGKLFPFEALAREPVLNDTFNGEALLVAYSAEAGTARAWRRTLDGRTLTFEAGAPGDGRALALRDRETGSSWSWLSGEAIAGALAGRRLDPVSHHPILSKRFAGFYPEGPVYE